MVLIVTLMLKGNPDCSIQIGDSVKKIMGDDKDHHPVGSEGIVRGNLTEPELGEAYLVEFDGDDGYMTFVIGKKIQKI